MNHEPQPEIEDDGISFLDLIRILLREKLTIFGLVVAAGAVFAVVTLLMGNSYQSTSALIIRKPEVPLTGEPSPLDISMVQALADSLEIKSKVYQKLLDEGKLPADLTYREFSNSLRTTVQKQVSRDLMLLPMIQLNAMSSDPVLAMEIANSWTDYTTSQTQETYVSGVKDLKAFTTQIYNSTNAKLADAEVKYTSAAVAANLSSKKAEFASATKNYGEVLDDFLKLRDQTNTTDTLLRETQIRLKTLEIDGVWKGEIYSDLLTSTNTMIQQSELTTYTARIISTLKNMRQKESQLAKFESKNQLQYAEFQLKNKEAQLQRVTEGIAQSANQLSKLQAEHDELAENLKLLEPKIHLRRALPEDMIYEGMAKNWIEDFKKLPALETEEINPNYITVQSRVIQLKGEIKGLQQDVSYFKAQQETLKSEVTGLARDITTKSSQRNALLDGIKRERTTFNFLERTYNELQADFETLREQYIGGLALQTAKEQRLVQLTNAMNQIEKHILTNEDKLAELQREKDKYHSVQTQLASKTEEVTLLEIAAKQASRSGLDVLFRAEINPEKIGPQRTKICLVGMLMTLALASAFYILRELMWRESRNKAQARG